MAWYKDKFLWAIAGVLALFKVLVLAYLYYLNPLGEQVLIFPDSLTYVYPAQTFLTYGSFWEAVSSGPMLLRTPGYPLFLALVQFLTGNLTWAVALFQNLLSVGLLVPVYLITRDLAGQKAARLGTLCTAISVLYFSLAFAVLTEMLCAFLLAWFVYFCVRFLNNPQSKTIFMAALFLATAIYVRPAAYYFAGAATVFLLISQHRHWKKILMAFVLPLLIVLGIWHLRNLSTADYSGFSTVNAYNLYFWNEDFAAQKLNLSIPQAHDYLQNALPENFNSYPAKEQVKIYRRMALSWLKTGGFYKLLHAPHWAAKTLLGTNFVHTSRLLLGQPSNESEVSFETLNQTKSIHANYLKTTAAKLIFAISLLQVLLIAGLSIAGIIFLYKTNTKTSCFLALYCLYFWGIGSVFFGAYARFRAPFEFVLCILAAIGTNSLLHRLQAQRKRIN